MIEQRGKQVNQGADERDIMNFKETIEGEESSRRERHTE
jgi:hypothetical protein